MTMSEGTLTALKGSIEKWEDVRDRKIADKGPTNCPLCQLFFANPGCFGCPVAAASGDSCCDQTPYEEWGVHQAHHDEHVQRVYCEECEEHAQNEVDFLKSLLPKEDPK